MEADIQILKGIYLSRSREFSSRDRISRDFVHMKTLPLINEAIKFFITGFIIIIILEIKEVEGLGTI